MSDPTTWNAGDYHRWMKPEVEPCPGCKCCSKALCELAREKNTACHWEGRSGDFDLSKCPCWRGDLVSTLYPTKTRLALLRHVAGDHVYRRHSVDIDTDADWVVTALMAELERAGWVDLRPGRSRRWRLTDAGRAVLDAHGGAS